MKLTSIVNLYPLYNFQITISLEKNFSSSIKVYWHIVYCDYSKEVNHPWSIVFYFVSVPPAFYIMLLITDLLNFLPLFIINQFNVIVVFITRKLP
jgi:hypothetical protein